MKPLWSTMYDYDRTACLYAILTLSAEIQAIDEGFQGSVVARAPVAAHAGDYDYIRALPRRYRDCIRPKVASVLALANAYLRKPGNLSGGCLHTVFEDGNLGDSSLEWSAQKALVQADPEGYGICQLMLRLSKTQRKRITEERWRIRMGER